MANLEMTIPHSLPQDEAITRIKNLLTEMKKIHGDKIANLKENWNGNVGVFSFIYQGFTISGILTVDQSAIQLNGKIPFAVSLFKGQITKAIYEKTTEILS